MKVIHLFRTSGAQYGLERNLLCTLPGLTERGVETVAVAVAEARAAPVSDHFAAELVRAGIPMRLVECAGKLPFRLAGRLSHVFRSESAHVVHSHDYKCDLAMLLADMGAARRMTTIHGWCSRNAKERFYEWLNVQCCKRMDAVVVFCEDYRRRLTSRGVPDRLIHTVPVGLDTGVVPRAGIDFRERWGVPAGAVLVAQIGRLSSEKRPGVFVRVAAGLAHRFPQARFVLVGDGSLMNELKRQAESLGARDAVLFAGFVREMADVLDAADIVVNCSSTEGIPRALLEAGVAGLPVVATAVGGTPDAIEDGVTGILCAPNDLAAIEAAVARLIEDAAARERMGAAARQRIATVFSIDTCSRNLIALYESLVRGKGAAA